MEMLRILLVITISLLGFLVLWIGTDGFQAYTSEGARRYAIKAEPRELPEVIFQDQSGDTFPLSSLQDQYVLFTFFYTQCGDICPVLEAQFKEDWIGGRYPQIDLGISLQAILAVQLLWHNDGLPLRYTPGTHLCLSIRQESLIVIL